MKGHLLVATGGLLTLPAPRGHTPVLELLALLPVTKLEIFQISGIDVNV